MRNAGIKVRIFTNLERNPKKNVKNSCAKV